MKNLFLLSLLLFSALAKSQLLYDPTVVYDGPGEMYAIDQIKSYEINFYSADYHDTLSQRWFDNNETRLPASFDFGTLHFDSVGVKYKGNSTFYVADLLNNPKVPYNIDINEYVGGQKVLGYKKLKLANALFDPTFAKEALSSMIYRQYMPTHQVALCKLTVNGVYMGVYVNTESIGKQFLNKHFGEKDGPFFKCEPSAQFGSSEVFNPADLLWRGLDTLDYIESYERKSDSGWVDLLDFINTLNNDPANIDQVLNVDRLLWYFAVTSVILNDDAYNTMVMHNYYLYKTGDGKFQMLPWDLSETFGGAMIGQLTHADHYERDPFYGFSPYLVDHPLVFQVLNTPYNQKKYMAHFRTVMDEYLNSADLKTWVQSLQGDAYFDIQNDSYKLFSMADLTNNIDNNMWWFTTEIAGITETVNNRKPYLDAHPEVVKVAPTIVSVNQSIQNPSSTDIVYITSEVTNADLVNLRVSNNPAVYASDFISVQMVDDGTGGDVTAGDNIYTAAIPYTTSNDHIKYYIEAENSDAMKLDPERAEYFYYHYYVDQVVSVENPLASTFSLYPNPTSDILNVSASGTYSVQIYSLNGQLIKSLVDVNGITSIDVSDFSKGNYILTVSNQSETKSEKFVVN